MTRHWIKGYSSGWFFLDLGVLRLDAGPDHETERKRYRWEATVPGGIGLARRELGRRYARLTSAQLAACRWAARALSRAQKRLTRATEVTGT